VLASSRGPMKTEERDAFEREEGVIVDGAGTDGPVDTSRAVARSPGVRCLYSVPNSENSAVFAAKWKFDNARVSSGNLTHGILACRTSGTATLTRYSNGVRSHRRPTIGSVTYVAPDTTAWFSGDGSCEVCHVYIPMDAVQRFAATDLTSGSVPRINDLFAVEDPWLKGFFQMLVSEFEGFPEGKQQPDMLFVRQAEHLLIRHLLRWHSDAAPKHLTALNGPHSVNPLRWVTLERIQEYIAANLAEDIALPDLAEIACMSIGHFLRAFRAASGTTPYHYVLEQRLRKASIMLRTTTLPIAHIATECGFKTPSHLSSKFRARIGSSPSRYRACAQSRYPARLLAN